MLPCLGPVDVYSATESYVPRQDQCFLRSPSHHSGHGKSPTERMRPVASPRGIDVDPSFSISPRNRRQSFTPSSSGPVAARVTRASFGGVPAVPPSLRNMANLSAGAQQLLACRNPIIFHVAEVVGFGAHCQHISFHNAIVVLLDPVQSTRIGDYELQIFAVTENMTETADAPAVRLSISPSSRIAVPHPSVIEVAVHGGQDGPNSYTLQFETATEAGAFVRDFQVRCRVMKLSLRTARQHQVEEARWQGRRPGHRQSLSLQLCSFVFWPFVALLVLLGAYALLLAKFHPTQESLEVMTTALTDAQAVASYIGLTAAKAGMHVGTAACKAIAGDNGSLLVSELEQCLALPGDVARLSCAESLVKLAHDTDHRGRSSFNNIPSMFHDFGNIVEPLSTTGNVPSDGELVHMRGVENTTPTANSDLGVAASASWESVDF